MLDEKALEKAGYGGIIGVGKGSSRPPRLVRLTHRSRQARMRKKVALVGKGITFDTGGISIKPAASMHHMTSDMGGAAAVIATVVLAAQLKLPVDVIATVPMAENMPSSTAQRPGDVLTQYGGITVEVLNTDAEGRLILADAIVRACEDNPDYLIETSTLTGAQTVALGARIPGVMGSDEFRDRVATISQDVGENGWPMPLPDELKDDLKSTVADLANVSGAALRRHAGGRGLPARVRRRRCAVGAHRRGRTGVQHRRPVGLHRQGRHRCAGAHHVRRAGGHRGERLSPGSALEFLALGALAFDAPTCVVIAHPLRVADLLHVVDGDLQLPGQPPGVALAAGPAAGPLAVAGHEHDGQIGDGRLGFDEAFDARIAAATQSRRYLRSEPGRYGRRGTAASKPVEQSQRVFAPLPVTGSVSLSIVPDSVWKDWLRESAWVPDSEHDAVVSQRSTRT